MTSKELHEFAEFQKNTSAKSATPGLPLEVIRDIIDTYERASTEPEDVTYAEVDAGGVPAMWAIPQGAAEGKALLHLHFGGSVTASMFSDRKAAGHIAKAAGIRSLIRPRGTMEQPLALRSFIAGQAAVREGPEPSPAGRRQTSEESRFTPAC